MAVPNYKFTKFESLLQQEPPSNGLALAYYAKLFRISPLHQAIESNQLSVGKILIREGCDIDSQDSEGCTALHYAVRKGNFTFCELLMCAGASAMIPNSDNATPVYQAWATSRDTIFRLLCPNMLERMKYGIWKAFLYRKDYR
ncbi:ankyrin repeat-containing domain protein [Bisporella sp. PMI_857]|nr:ankyrin repeat-containing domain protein [Bisporella sp. PMI_857]